MKGLLVERRRGASRRGDDPFNKKRGRLNKANKRINAVRFTKTLNSYLSKTVGTDSYHERRGKRVSTK